MSKGTSLRKQLEKQGRSVTWLAEVTGYSRPYVSRVLSGRAEWTNDFQEKAATALDQALMTHTLYRGRVIRVPERLVNRQSVALPTDGATDEYELAWKRSWLTEHGERVLVEAADRAWQNALALARVPA